MKNLDQYFNKAREEREIIPLAEIEEILSLKGKHAQSQSNGLLHTLFQRKEFRLATISAFTLLLGSAVVFMAVQDKTNVGQEVFIPHAQRRVMHLVKNISARPQNAEIRISQFGSNTNPKVTAIPIHLRSKFELSEDKLKLLGIRFTDELIKYEGNVKARGYVSFSVLTNITTSVTVDDRQWAGVKEYEFYPWFLTDQAGHQGVKYKFDNEPALKMTNSFFYNVIDQLIPIQVTRPGFKKVIFWFSQTPELMKILESAAMVSNNAGTLPDESADKGNRTIQIEIFPTITEDHVQVIVKVLKQQKLEISLLNSSGEVVQVPVNNKVLKEGDYNFSMDLSTFRKGLYFVRIKPDPGLITIHRLFKK
jgi:hypothetical protein